MPHNQSLYSLWPTFSKCFGIRLMATIDLLHFSILSYTRQFFRLFFDVRKKCTFLISCYCFLCIVIETMVWILVEIEAYRFNLRSTNNQYTTCITVVRSMNSYEPRVLWLRIVIKDTLPNVVIESDTKKMCWMKKLQLKRIEKPMWCSVFIWGISIQTKCR